MTMESIKALDRALDLLWYLRSCGAEVGISQIARDLGEHKSTIYRTLYTFEQKGYVYQNQESGKYWLGTKLISLGKAVENKVSITATAKPFLDKLQKQFNEVVNLSILSKIPGETYKSVIMYKKGNSAQILSAVREVGSVSECYISSVGKCLLAYGKDVNINFYKTVKFVKYTENSIKNFDELMRELEATRKNGYAMDLEEYEIGLTCIGAPILDSDGYALAAISLSGPTIRMRQGDINERIEAVKRTAIDIAAQR